MALKTLHWRRDLPEDEVIPAYPNGPTKETIIPNSP
jgi:hypothetical protein